MLCDDCGIHDAVLERRMNHGGHTVVVHLCADCHLKRVITATFADFSPLVGVFSQEIKETPPDSCSVCGTTGERFLQTSFLGCDKCYEHLADYILPVTKRVQAGLKHAGKTPYGSEYLRLQKELQLAVAREDFEAADIIKKEMRRISGRD